MCPTPFRIGSPDGHRPERRTSPVVDFVPQMHFYIENYRPGRAISPILGGPLSRVRHCFRGLGSESKEQNSGSISNEKVPFPLSDPEELKSSSNDGKKSSGSRADEDAARFNKKLPSAFWESEDPNFATDLKEGRNTLEDKGRTADRKPEPEIEDVQRCAICQLRRGGQALSMASGRSIMAASPEVLPPSSETSREDSGSADSESESDSDSDWVVV